jgi:D-cysteine desulfhydrase
MSIPLFECYSGLARKLPRAPLGCFPTPVLRLDRFAAEVGTDELYLKHDGVSGLVYGGNKVRKLEFLLGRAKARGATEVITFGYAGSNHAAATALCAREVGLRSISMLLPQANAHYVRRNLLLSHVCGAELHAAATVPALTAAAAFQIARHKVETGRSPMIVAAGGSSPLGTVGYVNAIYELWVQIDERVLPLPKRIYVPLGSMGTAVGLMLGLRVLKLPIDVVCVRVVDERYASARKMSRLFARTSALLHAFDSSFPRLQLPEADVDIRDEFFGEGYARFTERGAAVRGLLRRTEDIELDGTYTAKALAALVADIRTGAFRDGPALFWNTYNARDVSPLIDGVDFRDLPPAFHRYFEEPVQPLDRA